MLDKRLLSPLMRTATYNNSVIGLGVTDKKENYLLITNLCCWGALQINKGSILHSAQSGAPHSVSVMASFRLTQLSFSCPSPNIV